MLDSVLKQRPAVRGFQSQAARMFHQAGIRANWATIIGGILGIAAGVLFACRKTALGILALALSGGLDAVDGTIAREFERTTAMGGILDLTVDRLVEVAVLLGLIWPHPALWLPAAVVMATWYVNITAFMATGAALGKESEKLIHYPPGLVERTEALLFFVLLALAPAFGTYLCYAYATLEAATAIQRVAYAWCRLGASSDG